VQNGKDNKARGRVAKRQPNGKDGNNGHHADENERVEAAHAVGHHARHPPAQHAHGVEDRQQRVGKRFTLALAQRVRGQKRNAINHRQLAQEIGQGKPHKPPVSKRLKVNDVFKLELEVSALKARLHEHNGQYQHKEAYEPDHTDGPGKAHRGVEGAQNKRENDTSQTAADSGSAKRRTALIIKPVANNGNHWRHQHAQTNATAHSEGKEKLIVFGRQTHHHDAENEKRAAQNREMVRAKGIKHRAGKARQNIAQKDEGRDNPRNLGFGHVFKLIGTDVGLDSTNRVDEAKDGNKAKKAAKDHAPSRKAALGEGLRVLLVNTIGAITVSAGAVIVGRSGREQVVHGGLVHRGRRGGCVLVER